MLLRRRRERFVRALQNALRAKNSHRLARLHQQGLIRLQRLQRPHNRMKTLPIPRRLPRPSVNDKIFGLLRHFGIKVVEQHPQRRFLLPSFAGNLRPTRRPKRPLRQSYPRHRPLHGSWQLRTHEFPSPPLILAHAAPFCTRPPRSFLIAYFASPRILPGSSFPRGPASFSCHMPLTTGFSHSILPSWPQSSLSIKLVASFCRSRFVTACSSLRATPSIWKWKANASLSVPSARMSF